MRLKRHLVSIFLLITIVLVPYKVAHGAVAEGKQYAWFPLSTMNLSQIAYESYSHGSLNAIDAVGSTYLFAPFTGKVVSVSKDYTRTLFQSTNKVYYADGSYDYMTLELLHGANYSELVSYMNNGTVISQGTNFYKLGGTGKNGAVVYPTHVEIRVARGKVSSSTAGNVYAFNAFWRNTDVTKTVSNPGIMESGNTITNGGPSNWTGKWKTCTNSSKYDNDTEPPKIKSAYYSEVTATSFRLCCVPTDNVGVSSVKMATWTTGDQSDIKWIDARSNGAGTWFVDFNRNDYKNKILFITHIYVYDAAGNHYSKEYKYTYDTTPPEINKIYYSEKKPESFRICVVPKDMNEVSKVQIATWTTGDQSDIKWYDARSNGAGTWFVDHSEKDFKNNNLFISHVFVYDKSGNKASSEQFYYPDNTNPEIDDIEITEISKTGYKISCKVTDNDLKQVKFPTWTTNDQSDIIWHEGTIEDDTAYCYIKRSDHGDRLGYYITHVYAYDGTGNQSSKEKIFLYNTAAICDANGHDYQVVSTKDPTCIEKGEEVYKCTVCNEELTVTIMPTQVHDYGAWTKKDDKVHQRVCKHNANHIEEEAHKWDEGTITKPATETEEGNKLFTCTVCDATKEERIPVLTHTH